MREGKMEKQIVSVAVMGLAAYGAICLFRNLKNDKFFNQLGTHPDDELDTFDDSSEMSQEVEEMTFHRQEQQGCEFLLAKLHQLHTDLNFAQKQEQLDEIILDIEIVQDMAKEHECRDYNKLIT